MKTSDSIKHPINCWGFTRLKDGRTIPANVVSEGLGLLNTALGGGPGEINAKIFLDALNRAAYHPFGRLQMSEGLRDTFVFLYSPSANLYNREEGTLTQDFCWLLRNANLNPDAAHGLRFGEKPRYYQNPKSSLDFHTKIAAIRRHQRSLAA